MDQKQTGAVSAAVAHLAYTEGVGGSNPSPPILPATATSQFPVVVSAAVAATAARVVSEAMKSAAVDTLWQP